MLPRKFYVTLDALVYISLASIEKPVGAKELAEYLSLPPRYLEVILQGLVKEKVLRSVRGPRGGYFLGKERRKICISDIYTVVMNADEANVANEPELPEYIGIFGAELDGRIHVLLQQHTLDDLVVACRKHRPSGLKSEGNFVI
ncbi:MAG: Rrf2 family transcriptional regulator [Alphaproteobacteria bacterium]|nr:Rrf2 family transcriptional regulator [Alphaproteobacteria bacterium]